MLFKVFDDKDTKEKEVLLRLKQVGKNVHLIAVDSKGFALGGGKILAITEEGFIRLHGNIDPEIGLKLDDDGCIRIVED